jgi:AraC-like DNA-binding protein
MLTQQPLAVQRLGPVAAVAGLLRSHDVPLSDILAGLPVTEAGFGPDTFLPIELIAEILERSAARLGQPVGLLLGKAQNQAALGPLGELMMSCETLGAAIGTFVSVQIVHSTAAAAYLHRAGDDYAFGFGTYGPDIGSGHIYDLVAALGCNIVRDLTGGAVRPAEVLMSRAVPPDPGPYREFAGCPVRFNESQTCLILSGRSMEFRLPGADRARRERLLAMLQQKLAPGQVAMAGRVRHHLRPLLLAGQASLPELAVHLNLHPRTLERRLEEEGAAFKDLKDEVRLAVSRELLALTELAVSDIAATLDYATPSAFVRAFRRWAGKPPAQWRRELRSGTLSPNGKQDFMNEL